MKRNKNLYHLTVAGLFLLVASLFGTAGFAADQNPCSEDIAKFCKDAKPGSALLECLEEHETQLSDACKDYEERMGGARTESREAIRQQMRIRQACRDDVMKFCKDAKGGISACLKDHTNELSTPCREAVTTVRGGPEEEKKTK